MATFKDKTGFDWDLELTTGRIQKVKSETGVNLALASKEMSWLDAVYSDNEKLAAILYSICEKQAKAAGVEPEEFADRLTGPVLGAAGEALAVSVCDFFPRSKVAQALKTKLAQVMREADAKAVAAIESPPSTDSPKPTGAPASAASIPPT
jgi:hypothetical protein